MVMACTCPNCGARLTLGLTAAQTPPPSPPSPPPEVKTVVLEGIRKLGAAQIATSVAPSARNGPAKLLIERGWGGGYDANELTAATMALIQAGVLEDGVPFDGVAGRPKALRASRQPRFGVWFAERPAW